MTTRLAEPEWDEESRSLALALDNLDICPKCGRPAVVCQDSATQFDWVAGDPIRCHATTAVLARQQGVTDESNPQVEALLWPVGLRPAREEVTR